MAVLMDEGKSSKFPDVIIGLGGAGKNLVFNILNQEWFLKKIISSNQSVKFIVVDTATTEYTDDLKIKEKMEKKIEEISKKLEMPNRYIDIEVVCLTENLNLIGIADLIDEYLIKKAKDEGYIDTWWLYDPETGIDIRERIKKSGGEDFSHGTYRRRSLTKAVFYKAKSEGEVESSLRLSIGAGSTVAIIAGAGGGTGAGLALDIAKYIKEKYSSVTTDLFLILPSISEGDHEKSNAYAMLSELEYDRLKHGKDALFRNVILHPIERTKYRGGDLGAYSNKHKELIEFDEMFSYILYDYYKLMTTNAKTKIEDNIHKYCGYLLSTGGVIRYNIAPIKESKEEISKYLDYIQRSLDAEKELHKEIEDILNLLNDMILEFGGDILNPQIVSSDMDYVLNRFRSIFDTIVCPEKDSANPFSLLEYESPKRILEQLKNYMEPGEDIKSWIENIKDTESLKDRVGIIKRIAINLSNEGLVYKDETDRRLLSIIILSMENIETIIDQLEKASTLDFNTFLSKLKLDDTVKAEELMNAIKGMIKLESSVRWINVFNTIVQKLNNSNRNIEHKIRQLSKDIEGLSKKFEKNKSNLNDILSIIMPEISQIWALRKEQIEINSNIIDSIQNDLNEYISILNDSYGAVSNKDPSKLSSNLIKSKKDDIISKLNSLNIPESSKGELIEYLDCIDCVMKYKYMEKYYQKKLRSLSAFDKILGKDKKYKDTIRKSKNGYNEYIRKLGSLSHELASSYTPGGSVLPISLKEYLLKSTESEISRISKDALSKLESNKNIIINNDEFSSAIKNSKSKNELISNIEKLLIKNIPEFSELDSKLSELTEEMESLNIDFEESSKVYDKLRMIYEKMEKNVIPLSDKISMNLRESKTIMNGLKNKLKAEKDYKKMDFAYMSKIDPSPSIMSAVDEGSLKKIFESNSISEDVKKKEKYIINNELEMLVQKYLIGRHQEYLGIDSVSILIKDEKGIEIGRWTPKLSYAVVNMPIDIVNNESIINIENSMKSILQTNPKFTQVNVVDDCGDWDIAVSIFMGPISMDNINSVKVIGGYKDTYKKMVYNNDKIKEDAIFHHIYGLENGKLIIKHSLPSKEEFANYAKKEEIGNDISHEIIDNYYNEYLLKDIVNDK